MNSPGQKYRLDFPRFGLPAYTNRFPSNVENRSISIKIDDSKKIEIEDVLADLPQVKLIADFHCVTTWSYSNANWSGVKFIDFFEKHVAGVPTSNAPITGAVFYAQDGYLTALSLNDLLSEKVLIADKIDGKPLSIEHGAPLRLVLPDHYGYKNLKHLVKIEFYSTMPVVKRGIRAFLDHPRARVAREERGRWVPGRILRYLYRPLIASTVRAYREAMHKFKSGITSR